MIRIEKFVEDGLKPGERVYILRLTGHETDDTRKATVQKMNAARHRIEGKPGGRPIWDLFKIRLHPDPDNEYDPFAVEVWVSMKAKGQIQRLQIGFIKAKDKGKQLGHNRSVFKWLKSEKVLRTVVIDVDADHSSGLTWCVLGVVTSFDTTTLAKKCEPIENYGKRGTVETPPEAEGRMKVDHAPVHEGKIPVADSANYPLFKEIDELVSLHAEFEHYFAWEEIEDGETFTLAPVFLSQWVGEPTKFTSYSELQEHIAGKRCYGALETAVDPREVEELYGPIMASAYYLLSGKLAGPFTAPHVREILSIMRQVNTVLRESPLIHAQED